MSEDADSGSATSDPPTPVDRAAALAEGAPRMPRRYIYLMLGVVVFLGIGGSVLEHDLTSAGLNPTSSRAVPQISTSTPPPPTTLAGGDGSLHASLPAFMGLIRLAPHPAPKFTLTDQHGRTISLASQRGKVVVLTFFGGRCDDICPVLGSEIRRAEAGMGAGAGRVSFLVVNTDPGVTSVAGLAAALRRTGLGDMPNWHMLTGPLATLNAIWRAYGVSITVTKATGAVVHNNLMYFVDPMGRLRLRATPVVDESRTGMFRLAIAGVDRWAAGIARYASSLLPAR